MNTQDQQPSLSLFGGAAGQPESAVCSAKACRADARWVLVWNNPKLHTPDRRKTWLACDEHREHLSQFLSVRSFLKEVLPFADRATTEDDGSTGSNEGADGGR